MDRPDQFSDFRYVGDTRTQIVHDVDEAVDEAVVRDIVDSGNGQAFAPDTLAEARNRGYRPG